MNFSWLEYFNQVKQGQSQKPATLTCTLEVSVSHVKCTSNAQISPLMSFMLVFLCRGKTSHQFPEQHWGRIHCPNGVVWWTCYKVYPPVLNGKYKLQTLTTVDSLSQVRQGGEEAHSWTGKQVHQLTGIQRQLAVCRCKGSKPKGPIREGNSDPGI